MGDNDVPITRLVLAKKKVSRLRESSSLCYTGLANIRERGKTTTTLAGTGGFSRPTAYLY